MPDGTPIEIVLNLLGVPSRMNIGQVMKLIWLIAKALDMYACFDGASEDDILKPWKENSLRGKSSYDGRTGEPFDNEITVGMYMLNSTIC